ncbi:UPF0392 protein [Hibiscus syriacus]|uniref:Glycosyltransferase family 92 protein n=1 Tax=Hibiscus syriacus TaxID=106335 RepID=A0A6A2ZHH0_HIBSY|nr:UPF0392 protein [Hibiscus syriacus]
MESEQRRKRKRSYKPNSQPHFLSLRLLMVCLSFLVLPLFLSSSRFPIRTVHFHPLLSVSSFSILSKISLQGCLRGESRLPLVVEDRVLFPDHLLLLVSGEVYQADKLDCVYYKALNDSAEVSEESKEKVFIEHGVLSVDEYDGFISIVRCPLPPLNYSATAALRWRGDNVYRSSSLSTNRTVHSWDRMVYEAAVDGETVVVFVKGLNLRPHGVSNPTRFRCRFGLGSRGEDEGFVMVTKAVAAAQEVVRCSLPRTIRNNPYKAQGIRVSLVHASDRGAQGEPNRMPSVAKLYNSESYMKKRSGEIIEELDFLDYNVSRHAWPWIKTQEAGFSHCALRARDECKWVAFFDVDEFYYFPRHHRRGLLGPNSLRSLVANYSSSTTIAEIRTVCHSFGPSGLTSPPSQGVTVGYTCRLQSPERHKSIIRPDLLNETLLNVVHHFQLRKGFKYLNVHESSMLINHYKYQVWDTFRTKFFRRVATYVVDWQENQNQGSKDRAPGLGTEAIEPPNWRLQFCEVWDTRLRDFVLANLADPATGALPWEKPVL